MTIQTHKRKLSKAICEKEGWDTSFISTNQCIFAGHIEEVIYYAWDYVCGYHGQVKDFLKLVCDIYTNAYNDAYSYAAVMFSQYQAAEKCTLSYYNLSDTYIIKNHIKINL